MHTSTNSEDPDEMPFKTAFHQSLHCLPEQKRSLEKEIQFNLGIITCENSL